MSAAEMDSILDELVSSGRYPADEFIGCAGFEIKELMNDQEVLSLPASYVRFLERAGRRAGRVFEGSNAYYPGLLGVKGNFVRLLAENSTPWRPAATDFIIQVHQGYQVFWFDAAVSDPEIWMYTEGDEGPARFASNFVEYFQKGIPEEDIDLNIIQI